MCFSVNYGIMMIGKMYGDNFVEYHIILQENMEYMQDLPISNNRDCL